MDSIKALSLIVPAMMFTLSSSAYSQGISYDYIQGSFISITDSSLGIDVDGNAFSGGGSFSVSPNMAVSVGFSSTSFDRVFGIEVKGRQLAFGITAHTEIGTNSDVFGDFSIVNVDVEATDGFNTISDDDRGNAFTFGFRHKPSDNIEFGFSISRVDVLDDTDNTTSLGARFYTDKDISFGVNFGTGDDVDTLSFGARIDIKEPLQKAGFSS